MELSGQSQRWQGQRSAFTWEQSALEHIKAQMPDAEPYRAWQTFTFTTDRGHVREVDLFIATPGGLFLVEIKSHPGTAVNDGSTWLFRDGDKTRAIENPLHFTDQKAKELKTQLKRAADNLGYRGPLPRIEAVVFLSAETLRSRLDEFQRQRVYGRDGLESSTGLPGIWAGFLNQPPASERNRVTPTLSAQLPKLMHEIGIARLHRIGRVGVYELNEKSFDSGPTWEDYLAANPSLPADYPRRVRVFLAERTASDEDRKSVQRAAHREYLALQGISHDGIVRAEAYSDELLTGPAVVFRHGASWQRLDHFVAGHQDLPLDTRLQMIRQLAEALDHAHRRHLYHRALAPRSVYVELDGRYLRLRMVLATVFVRFCEDNGLIEYPFIAGPGDRVQLAADLQGKYYENHPSSDDLGWLRAAIDALSVSPVAAGLFDKRHNPMWTILPSPQVIKELLAFWRQTGEDGQVRFDLTDLEWDTRFLGDLYQDLSEAARKTYALLQTPEFVEEFILDYTLDPAIEEFGLSPEPPVGHEDLPPGLRVIDPACGSGHFLLGAFRRVLAAWETASPASDRYELVARALSSVHGVDKNPFAAAIARFRLMLAGMRAAGVERLTVRVDFPVNIAVGDSLLHGKGAPGVQGEFDFGEESGAWTYRTEDVGEYIKSCHILEYGSYHLVVANPPYITVKDKAENDSIRKRYEKSCSGAYALSVPFAERIFGLAVLGSGYTGQITANSFMKREFGKKLVEQFFPSVDLTYIIDTSGAYIPGHGTPTVILIGRRRFARSDSTIRAVLGIRGEPGPPDDPARGLVWQAIIEQIGKPGSESEWVSVSDATRGQFAQHPWSLSGGGADELKAQIELTSRRLDDVVDEIGSGAVTREDEAYMLGSGALRRARISTDQQRPLVEGDVVRDFRISDPAVAFWPYDSVTLGASADRAAQSLLWPYRSILRVRVAFGMSQVERGLAWFEYSMFFRKRFKVPFILTYAEVATHNHFVLDRGGKVFNRTAPVIKLPESATEDDYLALLGVLNSSTACFWLREASHDKGNRGGERSTARYEWEHFFQFNGTRVREMPLPIDLPLEFGREIDALTRQIAASTREEDKHVRGQMISLQEELDWDVYRRYGLLTDEQAAKLIAAPASVPNLLLGQRAFEIVMARRVESGGLETQWFARHRSTPITEIPGEWPEDYRQVVERRIAIIESNRNIGLIERPECKRRWQSEPWEVRESRRLTTWLLDRCEDRSLWYDSDEPRPMTVNRLADRLRADAEVITVARELKGPDADLADVLKEIIAGEHVPYLAAHRYKPSGLDKRAQWERTWDLQREEDRTGKRLDIDVPLKYVGADFVKQSYWRHRGKLDVPKERFISYPGASPDSDSGSLLIGWAGWDHKDQATALIGLIADRSTTDGWDTGRLTPLLAGLLEIMPWVRQWHSELDLAFGQSPAEAYDAYLTSERESRSLTEAALRAWRPPQSFRGRRA